MAGLRLVRGLGLKDATTPAATRPAQAFPASVTWLSLGLACAGAAAGKAAATVHDVPDTGVLGPVAVGALLVALVGAACLQLRFSFRDHFEALDLFDAVLAPAIFSLSGPVVVAVAAAAMAVSELVLRTRLAKACFNVAQWAAAAGAGTLLYGALAHDGGGASAWNLAALALAMVLVSVVNHLAMAAVFSVVAEEAKSRFRTAVALLMGRSWAVGSSVNLALGLLLVAAINTGAWAMPLFAVPLSMLHWANRGYAEGRADRARLSGLQRATHALMAPIDPRDGIPDFLAEVRSSFSVEVVEVVVVEEDGGYRAQRLAGPDAGTARSWRCGDDGLAVALLRTGVSTRVDDGSADSAALALLRREGWRDCLAAPLVSKGEVRGVLCAYNRAGLERFQAGELPVFDALAAELAGALDKAELVEEVFHQAMHDALTGLPNRTLFHQRVQFAIEGDGPGGGRVAVVLIDLNRFKEVNDTLGHHLGDLLLQDFSRRLQACLRPNDTVARLGGDEFAIVIPHLGGVAEARHVVERVVRSLDDPFVLDDMSLGVDAAIGIALFPDHGADAATLLQRADVAMYASKGSQSAYAVYSPENDRYSPRRLALVGELRNAAANDELRLHYQPKSDLRTGRITGLEALLRWYHPMHGPVAPDEFIPIAEQTGSIGALTGFVLREALSQCAAWRSAGLDLTVAVNLSVRSLLDADLPRQVSVLLDAAGVPARCLTIELTETTLMTDPARTADVLECLDGLGVQLSIDDFGTGYSSLAYLQHLPVHEMKIDKSFVMAMRSSEDAETIVRSTVDLAHNLGLRVVAEGVEDAPCWDRLVFLGCDAAQGYYVSKPVPAAEVEGLVERLQPAGTAVG